MFFSIIAAATGGSALYMSIHQVSVQERLTILSLTPFVSLQISHKPDEGIRVEVTNSGAGAAQISKARWLSLSSSGGQISVDLRQLDKPEQLTKLITMLGLPDSRFASDERGTLSNLPAFLGAGETQTILFIPKSYFSSTDESGGIAQRLFGGARNPISLDLEYRDLFDNTCYQPPGAKVLYCPYLYRLGIGKGRDPLELEKFLADQKRKGLPH